MSIEIIYYPEIASKGNLRKHLVGLGFQPCNHLWNWPKESLHFWWFEASQYKSFDGIEATIYPKGDKERESYPRGDWALHTRTRASASPGDREYQNLVIRTARKKFGGEFINDWYGRNRYIPIESDRRDAVARGIYLSYEHVISKISAVKFALPNPNEGFEKLVGTKFETLATADPVRVLYNALVPFAVAAIEHFFSQSFKILLKYDEKAQERLRQQSRKIEIPDVLSIRDGKKTIEDVVADWYSFQRITSIHAAFNEWFGINFWNLLRRRKKIGKRMLLLEKRLNQLIEFRHGLVHRFELDLELRRKDLEEILELVVALIDIFVDELERRRKIPIRD